MKPSKWPFRMRSPIGDGARGGGAGTPSVARRRCPRGEPERGDTRGPGASMIGGGVVDLAVAPGGGCGC